MADEQIASTPPGADVESNKPTPGAEEGNASTLNNLSAEELAKIIADLRKENASHRSKLRETEKAEQDRAAKAKADEEERLKKQGEFQTLAEQRAAEIEALKAQAAKAEALEARIKAANDARIAKIPDAQRTLVPDYDPAKLSEWLDANFDKLAPSAAPDLDGGRKGDHNKAKTTIGLSKRSW